MSKTEMKQVNEAVPAFMQQGGEIEGFENADAETFAIPFLRVLQSGSPAVKKSDQAAYIKGAEEGMLIDTVSKQLFDGEDGVTIVVVKFDRKFVEWKEGGGFVGEHAVNSDIALRATRDPNSSRLLVGDGSTYLEDTRYLYVVAEHDGDFFPALITMKSTQIKKSKALMSLARNLCMKHKVNLFALKFTLTTVPESNDQNSWWGVKLSYDGIIADKALYDAVVDFRETLTSEVAVQADFQEDNF